jgi:hypothetical protein
LLGQCLHAFPVPGSQIAWGSLIAVPIAAIGAYDAGRWLSTRFHPVAVTPRRAQLSLLLVLAFTATTAYKFGQLALRYRDGKDLRLPGAELIRIPDPSAALCRLLAYNASVHGDMLFSLPGTFSFNFWTGLDTPTFANVTHWFSLLDESQQSAIIGQLEKHPRACVIIWRGHVNFLAQRGMAPKGPLYDYITQAFEPVFAIDEVEFCVHRGRRISPVMVGHFSRAEAPTGTKRDVVLSVTVVPPPLGEIARIDLSTIEGDGKYLTLDATNSHVEMSSAFPPDAQDVHMPSHWPLRLSGASTLKVRYSADLAPRPQREATVIFRDSQGQEVGMARMLP